VYLEQNLECGNYLQEAGIVKTRGFRDLSGYTEGDRRHTTACTDWELLRRLVDLSLGCAVTLPFGP